MGESNSKRKEIVQMLLKNKVLDNEDEEQLMEILFNEPISIDVDKKSEEEETWKDRLADRLTEKCGSWSFILGFTFLLIAWMVINTILMNKTGKTFDEYPFILLNLVLSCVAALQAPIIMMSQNRAAKKDSLRAKNDYKTDLKSEIMLEELHEQIKRIQLTQNKILRILNEDEKEK